MDKNKREKALLIPRLKLGYQSAISMFSILLFLIFLVFSLGFIINLHNTVKLWQEDELITFQNLSKCVSIIIDSHMKTHAENERFSPEIRSELQDKLRSFKLDVHHRIYVATRKKTYLIFPEQIDSSDMDSIIHGPATWQEGWQGKSGCTSLYETKDGMTVKAFIQPLPPSNWEPTCLVVVEKDLQYYMAISKMVSWLDSFLVIGLIGCAFVLFIYRRTVIDPFKKLDSIVHRFGKNKKRVSHDPVRNAIESFETTLSELKNKESQLENMNALLKDQSLKTEKIKENILSTVNSGVMTFDLKYRLLSITSGVFKMLNIQDPDPVGQTCDEILGKKNVFSSMLGDGLRKKIVFQNREWKWQIPGMETRWFSITSHLLTGEFDVVSGVGFIVRDISIRKSLEEQMRDKEHLAALGELSAGIAHEFRNPLGVIRGNVDLLKASNISEENQEVVDEIKNEINVLNRIIQDFLKFARPTKLKVASVNITSLIQDLIGEFNSECKNRIQCSVETNKNVQSLEVDETLIRQILFILIENASLAIEDKGNIDVTLDVVKRRKTEHEMESYLLIRISDTGKGVPAEHFDKLFKPFFTTKPMGTGLGLAIAKKLVLMHNGFIEFEKDLSIGAAVRIMLPMKYDPNSTTSLKGFEKVPDK